MEILRVPPYPVSVQIEMLSASTSYTYTVIDMADFSTTTGSVTSNANKIVTINLPSDYDGEYEVKVGTKTEYYSLRRPYINPNTKGTTASEIEEYARNEELARAIIDSVVDEEFYFEKKVIETTGIGADYLPVWNKVKNVLKVYENNVLVWDIDNPDDYEYEYAITDDGTAVTIVYPDAINKDESAPIILPSTNTDLVEFQLSYRGFPKTFDYRLVLEVGYPAVPSDVARATELLVEDISCGKLDYYKRYISQYNTDQFRIQFDKSVFEGTGNLIVDKILSKYSKSVKFIGVL